MTYIDVHDGRDVSVGIFVVDEGGRIPLHNHPGMFGVIKCLSGRFDLASYTALTPDEWRAAGTPDLILQKKRKLFQRGMVFPTRKEVRRGVTPAADCSALTPDSRNYHEVTAVGGPAAFIDILAPPYSKDDEDAVGQGGGEDEEERRECDFFKEILTVPGSPTGGNLVKEVSWLQWIPAPRDYFCDSEEYRGPLLE